MVAGTGPPPAKSVRDVYERGVKAVKAEKWEEANTALRAAVAADPTPRHYREGVIPADYLPQYYLFVAYARSGDMVNAAQYSAARGGVPTQNDPQFMLASAAFSRWQSDNAMAASSTMAAAQSAIRYDALIKEGDASLTAKNYAAALSAYDQARSTRGINDARKRAAETKLSEARDGAAAAAVERANAARAYDDLMAAGDRSLTAHNFDAAIASFSEASGLPNIDSIRKAAAERKLADARAVKERLETRGDPAAPRLVAVPAPTAVEKLAHDGFVALMSGDAAKAAHLLEASQASPDRAPASFRATVAAYLAVAYASMAIEKNDKTLETKAKQQFAEARQIERGFKLDDRLVSPQVKKLLESK